MGCTTSRVVNEDTVRRCKERRRLMKEAVHSRHHLAASHSDYLRSLRHVASALTHFSSFLSLSVHPHSSPPVLLRPSPPPPSTVASSPTPPTQFSGSFREKSTTTATKKKKSMGMSSSTYASTPSQSSSSAWNWEEFYPPSPPRSEFFDRLNARRKQEEEEEEDQNSRRHHLPEEVDDDDDEEEEKEEAHYSRTSSSSTTKSDVDGGDETTVKSDFYGSSAASVNHQSYHNIATPISEYANDSGVGEVKMVVRHKDLKEIAAAIEENFLNAAAAGEGLSDLLESGRAQLDRSFRQLKKTVYHSSSVLSNLSSTWTSKPPLAVRYRLDTAAALGDSGGRKSHCSTLDQLLAWEKKLYQEVKAREGVKIEHEKKLSALQSQEYKGKTDATLDKTKTSINRLQSLILVTSQAVYTTSSAIIKVRDDELAPQLFELCCGFWQMWRSMNQFHEVQNHIVQQVHDLVNNSTSLESTSELYRQATRYLESAVLDWHSSFIRLIKFHRSYIQALYAWLKLTFFRVSTDESEKDHYSSLVSSELSSLCDEWKQALDRLPDTVAAEAIKSFANVIHSISMKQEEELKIKKKVETYSKELEKKSLSLQSIEKRFYESYSMVGIGIPDVRDIDNHGQVFDMKDPLAEKKTEIAAFRRKVEDEIARYTKAIKVTREMTLNNIRTGLPGVFQAITGFTGLSAAAFEGVCRRAGAHK